MVVVPALVSPVTEFVVLIAWTLQRTGARGLRVTSWLRSEADQEDLLSRGRGVVRSLHLRGLAMDLVGPPASLMAFAAGWVALGLDAVLESDHLHIELDGPSLRAVGIDFRVG